MGDGGLLSLSWNNHKATFCHILSTLREKERYTDVTLACEGKFYPVHKLVLSTCSEYFESMFEHTPCKHPIIVLKDLKSDEVESLLSYMYAGVVNVAQNDLARLIKAAELLKVKGLAVPDEPPQEVENRKNSPRSSRDDRSSPHPKRRRRDDSEGTGGEQHGTTASPPASPRTSPYHTASEFHQDNSRTHNEGHTSEHRTEKSIDRLEHDVRSDAKSTGDLNPDQHNPANPCSPIQVMLEETLVKEEIMDHLPEDKDSLLGSGMDYGSMTSDGRLENSSSDGGTQEHQLLSAKYEQQSLAPSQTHHLPEAVVEALAGPSGMQGWLGGGGDMSGTFSGVDSYGGDGRHQDLRQPLPTQQPQAHQMVKLLAEAQLAGGERVRESRTHNPGSRTLRCPFCAYTTYQTSHLKYHIRTHTGEKPFSCPHCPFRCNRNSSLKIHLRKHTGEKPYTCPHCPYQSTVSSHIKRHLKTHNDGEKDLTCAQCFYRTRDQEDLLRHVRMHFTS
ncbi:broad-complex core protein isoforms 1/2/3/4/5-like isoform X2 [Portunus trituberculatus]|uniref:broad-complex core protein isoforms 1/2/3/4/5-like isoform X2 n=1 Tax=Portunus trituberculatus TaxID=210409 RepID=UPI001E1D1F49|nr:broad-complex core protein isoforms 1/2/3/4/5-like isoform X2 [Portunus trituberculatus]XP_045113651.1 broad-complex core protein isoforms 1/2/3/4/5-like isoform X2 [Portunus trituberculatus]